MKTKRITALALCLVMLFSLLPAAALAEDALPEEELLLEEELELLPEPELIPEDPPEEPDALPSLPEELPEELSEPLMLLGEPYGEQGEGDFYGITLDYNYDNKPAKTLRVASPYTLPNITREDHTLLGWSTSPDGPDYYPVGTAITLTDGMTLYAIWRSLFYGVTLDYNYEGSGQGNVVQVPSPYTPPSAETIGRPGEHELLGWTTSLDDDGVLYPAGTSITLTGDLTLYAIWDDSPLIPLFTVSENSDGTLSITGYRGYATELTIPGKIDGKTVTAIGEKAFYGKNLTSVTLPNSVKEIGFSAFSQCLALESINLSSVKDIGNNAFMDCERMQSVTLRDVKSIGTGTFYDCDELTDIYYEGTEAQWGSVRKEDHWYKYCSPVFHCRCTVTFDNNGHGTAPAAVTAWTNKPIDAPAAPTDSGYIFKGWYKEPECETPWDFTDDVTGDMTLYAKWEADPNAPKFMSHTLLLSGEIGVNFYMDLSTLTEDERKATEMEFTVNGRTQVDKYDPDCKNPGGDGYYGFTCFITSVEMADKITAVLKYGDGQTVSQTYSASQYVQTIKANSAGYSQNTLALINAIADYGHYVQPFLADTNKWTVGIDHAAMTAAKVYKTEDVGAAKTAVSGYAIARDTRISGIAEVKYSLNLQSETSIYLYLQPNADFTGSVTAMENGSKLTCVHLSDGRYRVTIPHIQAHELGDTHTVTVIAGGVFTISVSALSYVHTALNSEADVFNNPTAQYAVSSLYYYYQATMNYKNKPNG